MKLIKWASQADYYLYVCQAPRSLQQMIVQSLLGCAMTFAGLTNSGVMNMILVIAVLSLKTVPGVVRPKRNDVKY